MIKRLLCTLCAVALVLCVVACDSKEAEKVKIGVSFGVGEAVRWPKEMANMEARAKELGAEFEGRINKPNSPKSQMEDCLELLAGGIDVLILTPRDVNKTDEIITVARQRNVKVISYARATMDGTVELFVGFDCYKIGQNMGQHLTELMYRGDLIILKGDKDDFNTPLLYYGAMKFIRPLVDSGDINLILDEYVDNWSVENAKKIVRDALVANNNSVDAILAPNDALAGACAEVLKELNITKKVIITGMDAELAAAQRIVRGTQDVTVHLDLAGLASRAVDEAYNLATKKTVSINSSINNEKKDKISAYLMNGKVVTLQNIDKILIEPGVYTREQVYGE